MKRTFSIVSHARFAAAALAGALLLAGCSTPSFHSPVEVTRFAGQAVVDLRPGPVSVRSAPRQGENGFLRETGPRAGRGDISQDRLDTIYRAALGEALAGAGFDVATGAAPYVAQIEVERQLLVAGGRRGPVSVGGGASTGSYGSGVGLGIGLDLTPPDPDEIDTQIFVSIRPSGGGDAIWEGRARFTASANNEFADPEAAARRMTSALLEGFPGNSGETISVQ